MVKQGLFITVVLLLMGCGSTSGSSSGEPATSTTSCLSLPGAALTPRTSPAGDGRKTMYLTGMSEDWDPELCQQLVIFDFVRQASGPGFEVSYEPASVAKAEDGSGKHIDIAGSAFLVVRISPAMTAKINGDHVTKTYTGPNRIKGTTTSFVQEIVKTGDFENTVTWVIGLDRMRPFKTIDYDDYGGGGGFEIQLAETP